MKACFIGHRKIAGKNVKQRLIQTIEKYINIGVNDFIVGTHGEFDNLALSVLRELRNTYKDIKICVVFTTLNVLKKEDYSSIMDYYKDVETTIYDFEEQHYKRQITYSNERMIDDCDILICYVDTDEYRSGAKIALKYAQKQNKEIVNLFRVEDRPFYGMTKEEIKKYWNDVFKKKG